jgi:hypothetical protein
MRNAYKICIVKRGERRPPARCRQRYEYNIKMDLKAKHCEGVVGIKWLRKAEFCEVLDDLDNFQLDYIKMHTQYKNL